MIRGVSFVHWCVAVMLPLLACIPGPAGADLFYRFAAVDASAGKRIPAASMQVVLDDDEPSLAMAGAVAVATVAREAREVRIAIDAGTGYWSRKIKVLQHGIKRGAVNEFAVEPRPPGFTKQYLLGGTRRFDQGEIDRGLALFEQAFYGDADRKSTPVLDDYEVILRYNYARGLQQACLRLHYETCADAREHLRQILADMGGAAAKLYTSNRVPRDLVEQALADLDTRDVKKRYEQALAFSRAGKYAQAKELFNNLLQEFSRDPASLADNDLTEARLQADINLMNTRLNQAR
jgi:hypothetical protein